MFNQMNSWKPYLLVSQWSLHMRCFFSAAVLSHADNSIYLSNQRITFTSFHMDSTTNPLYFLSLTLYLFVTSKISIHNPPLCSLTFMCASVSSLSHFTYKITLYIQVTDNYNDTNVIKFVIWGILVSEKERSKHCNFILKCLIFKIRWIFFFLFATFSAVDEDRSWLAHKIEQTPKRLLHSVSHKVLRVWCECWHGHRMASAPTHLKCCLMWIVVFHIMLRSYLWPSQSRWHSMCGTCTALQVWSVHQS